MRIAMTIVIADDQKHFREFLRRMFESDPALNIVGEAASGEEAVRVTELLDPDLLLLNIDMPQGDGLEATRRLKAQARHAKIISMSVLGDEAHRRAALASGADGFIVKSAPISAMLSLIWDLASSEGGLAAGTS
jgi:two-component system, NarL family, response regulator DegU